MASRSARSALAAAAVATRASVAASAPAATSASAVASAPAAAADDVKAQKKRLKAQVKAIDATIAKMTAPLRKEKAALEKQLMKLDINKYAAEAVSLMKKRLKYLGRSDARFDRIEALLATKLDSMPDIQHTKEQGKYYDPSWDVCTVTYEWDGESMFYETWHLWSRPDDKPAYTKGSFLGDGEHIRDACKRIIEDYSKKDDADEAWEDIEGLGEYLPVLIAYLEGQMHRF